jgi:hypothetical protein
MDFLLLNVDTVDSRNSGPLDLTVSICGPKELEIPIFTLDLTVSICGPKELEILIFSLNLATLSK